MVTLKITALSLRYPLFIPVKPRQTVFAQADIFSALTNITCQGNQFCEVKPRNHNNCVGAHSVRPLSANNLRVIENSNQPFGLRAHTVRPYMGFLPSKTPAVEN